MPKVLPPSIGRGQARKPYCEVLIVSPGERSTWGPMRDGHAQAAARDRRVRLRAGGRRQLRGRGAGGARQLQHPGGRDLRRLRLRVAEPAARPARADRGATCRRPPRRATAISPCCWRARVRAIRPELDVYLSTDRDVAKLAGSDEAAGIRRVFFALEEMLEMHLAHPRRHQGPLRDAVLRQPEEIRAAADRHLPRAADRARQVDLQVELDPRHGRVLRREPVPRRVLGHDRRPRQPARADRQHQGGAGQGGARLRRRPHVSSSPTAPPPRTRSSTGGVPARATSC